MLKDKDLDKLFKSKFEGTSFEPDASSMEAAEQMVDMTSSGELDQLFREKFAAMNPAPPAESIAHMEGLLAAKKRFAWGRFGIAAGAILLLLSAGLWYFMKPDAINEPIPTEEVAAPNGGDGEESSTTPFENSNDSDTKSSETDKNESGAEDGTRSFDSEETQATENIAGSTNEKASPSNTPTSDNEPMAGVPMDGNDDVDHTHSSSSTEEQTDGETAVAAAESNSEEVNEAESEIATGESVPPIDNGGTTEAQKPEHSGDESDAHTMAMGSEEVANEETADESENELDNTEASNSETAKTEAENSESTEGSDSEETTDEDSEAVAIEDEQVENDVEEGSARNPKAPGFDNRKGYNNYFGLIAGLSVAPSFDAANSSNPVSTNVILGLRYAYQIRPELTLNVNALYSDRTGINQTKEVHDTIYHFGMATRSHYITPTRLHYVEMPIYLSWQMDRNHSLSIGVSPAVLIGQNNRIDLVSQDSFDNMDYQTETHAGRSEGILNYDASVMMGYTYRVNEYWSVGVRGQYGLFDITNNEYYHSPKTHRNLFIRFMAEYKLPF
mgnify:CR=1 FL=1